MNILFTCAGRRTYLLKYFRDALQELGVKDATLVGADLSPSAPALSAADVAVQIPHLGSHNYVAAVLGVCEAHNIDLLVPLNDLELPILAASRDRFDEMNVQLVVSSPEVVDICFDKVRTAEVLDKLGIRNPKTFTDIASAQSALHQGVVSLPLVVKPRWGSASAGVSICASIEELELAFNLARLTLDQPTMAAESSTKDERSILIQECLASPEYSLDVINDLNGDHVTTVVKQKLLMRSGETDRAVTVDEPEFVALGARIARELGHIGNLDCDGFIVDGEPAILEMNPRFGGGYPFSHAASINLPAALIAWRQGIEPKQEWFEPTIGTLSAKTDVVVTFPKPMQK